ncbi:MAG: MFS transporter [Bradyrhizobium sp.]|uniref:MFS transporter n=1 Tax=Bradyrhizobium sp. TaxID=376 RepID=UPI001DFD2052|nr:MFS transporter [Bradyrhizobium sp.]MBV9564663.1 MFS transporter [Bradyrhizobium sp.]
MQVSSVKTHHEGFRAAAQRGSPRSRHAASLTLAAMSLGFAVVQLDVTIVNTALSSIGAALGGGVFELQWIVSAYTIVFAAFILSAGALGDRVGAKRVFMAGFAIFTAASVACALAPNAVTLIAARAVQGLGAAILVPNSLALLNHAYHDETSRGRAVGIWAAGASLALTAGPFVGGGLIELVGWRSIFLVNLPIGLVGLWLTLRYAEETARAPQRELDLPGQVAAVVALGGLTASIIEGGAAGWTDRWVMAGFVACAVAAVLFVVREQRTAQPMLPLGLFRHRTFALAALLGLFVNIAYYGLIFVFSLYFQQVNGWSPFATGLAFMPMMGVVLPANLGAPRLAERIGAPRTIALGAVLAALGALALLGMQPGTGYLAICGQLVALSVGLGLLVPPLTSTLLGSVEKARSGVAAGVLNASRQTGSATGVALFGSLAASASGFMRGAHQSLIISASLLLLSAVLIWRRDRFVEGGSRHRSHS